MMDNNYKSVCSRFLKYIWLVNLFIVEIYLKRIKIMK